MGFSSFDPKWPTPWPYQLDIHSPKQSQKIKPLYEQLPSIKNKVRYVGDRHAEPLSGLIRRHRNDSGSCTRLWRNNAPEMNYMRGV